MQEEKIAIAIDRSGSLHNLVDVFATAEKAVLVILPDYSDTGCGSMAEPINELAKKYKKVIYLTDGYYEGKPAPNVEIILLQQKWQRTLSKKQAKRLWKQILEFKYAVEKTVDCSPHPHILKKIGDLKTSIQYIEDLEHLWKTNRDKINNSDNVLALLSIPKAIREVGLTEKDTEIYFAFMNDKYWYSNDCDDKTAIEEYWLDTVVIKCIDKKKLRELIKHFEYDWDSRDRMFWKLTGKKIKDEETFDEIDLVGFPKMDEGKEEALRLWLD